MSDISTKQVAAALAAVLRERFDEGEALHLPGLGTFRPHHEVSRVEERADGSVEMKPPRDVIAFSADA